MIQRANRVTEGQESETSGSKESQSVGSRKNIKQKENIRYCEVSSIVEEIYNRIWYMEERGRLGKYKRSSSLVWEEDEYRSKTTRKIKYNKEKKL